MLKIHFNPSTTGVDIGEEYVRVFSLTPRPMHAQLGCTRMTAPSTALVARLENTATALEAALQAAGNTTKKRLLTAITLPTATLKEALLPRVNDIGYYLTQHHADYFTSPLADIHWDWIPLPAQDPALSRILLVTCPQQKIQFLSDVATLMGGKWDAIDLDILALHHALCQFTTQPTAAALYLSHHVGIFFVFSQSHILFINPPIPYSQKQPDENSILNYVRHCINAFSSHTLATKISEIIIVGNITTQSGLANRIHLDTGISTLYGNPFSVMRDITYAPAIDIAEGPKWALAYGLALRGVDEKH